MRSGVFIGVQKHKNCAVCEESIKFGTEAAYDGISRFLGMEPPPKRRHCLLTEVLNMEAGLKIKIFQ